jgi:hypothetical protein
MMRSMTRQASLNIRGGQVVVLLEDLFGCPTASQKVYHELDRNARPFNDGFADKHFRVHADSFVPVHLSVLSLQAGRSETKVTS